MITYISKLYCINKRINDISKNKSNHLVSKLHIMYLLLLTFFVDTFLCVKNENVARYYIGRYSTIFYASCIKPITDL